MGCHDYAWIRVNRFEARSSCSSSVMRSQCLHHVLQTGHVRRIQHLRALVDAFHETTQRSSWTLFDEASEAVGEQVAHGLLPANRGGDLIDQTLSNFISSAVRLGGHVGDNDDSWPREVRYGQHSLQPGLGGGHQRRMISAG